MVPTGSKGEATRRVNDHLFDLKTRINTILAETEPAVPDGGLAYRPGSYDMVVHFTDLHIGQLNHDEFGVETFNLDIAVSRVRETLSELFAFKEKMEVAGYRFDTIHILLGGDTVDGEGIYENHAYEVCATADQQIDTAVELLYEVILSCSSAFPSVQVVCQPGNHGEIRAKNTSEAFNADTIVFGFLDRLVRVCPMDNVKFIRNESTEFTNFLMRGGKWRGHLRHGDGQLPHIGTTSSKSKWGLWLNRHKFDVAYRGHYHEVKLEPINGVPVIMGGSITPSGDYEDSIGVYSEPSSMFHIVSDRQPVEMLTPVHFAMVEPQLGGSRE
ncbi:hypothetical protein SAMN04488133_1962 [Halobellus limi]|nr:hypothetical protein SAMN04488133_1962 [Halobellus limi]